MTAVIEITGLRKTFRRGRRAGRPAVDGFDMRVDAGQVHGFLGPNGSGKTTTLRALLGLVRADAGRLLVFGRPVPQALPELTERVGAIVETPRFFGNFTGRRTLRLLATAGRMPAARVDEVLAEVGLYNRADEPVGSYSLGMKQRLAVATALLKRPRLLILDEPTNGLDPAGMMEMREMIRQLATTGVTILVSSHLLAEIEQVCDTVTIISRGRRVGAGPVAEVLGGHDAGEVQLRVAEPERAAEVLRSADLSVVVYRPAPGDPYLVVSGVDDPARVTRLLGEQGLWLHELTGCRPDLESVFLDLTGTRPVAGQLRQLDDAVLPDAGRSAAVSAAARADIELDDIEADGIGPDGIEPDGDVDPTVPVELPGANPEPTR